MNGLGYQIMGDLGRDHLGFPFEPTEAELVLSYLRNKIQNEPLPPGGVIEEVELYGKKNPWKIFTDDSTQYFYVFAQLKRRKKRKRTDGNGGGDESVRFDRTAGIGTWKCRRCENKVDPKSTTSWFKKYFIFEVKGNAKNFDHGRWIMMELSLPGREDYVICRIHNKDARPKPHRYKEDKEAELVLHYLRNKIQHEPLPPGVVIEEVELYGKKNPWEIFREDSLQYFYVFTQLKRRKTRKRNADVNGGGDESVRFDRTAGIGTWKCQKCNNKVDPKSTTTWYKKYFIFEVKGNAKNFDHGRWIMMELSLPGREDYAICRIYNKDARPKPRHCNEDKEENETPLAILTVPQPYLSQPVNPTKMDPLVPLPLPAPAIIMPSDPCSSCCGYGEHKRISPPPTAQQFSSQDSNSVDSSDDLSLDEFPNY